jgi:hypothetical protein
MATKRLPMRYLREVLRQKLEVKRSHREVARSGGVSHGSVSGAVSRAKAVGLDWAQIQTLSDDARDERLYGSRDGKRQGRAPLPDAAYLHVELRRAGVTLQLLHLEYLESHANGYRYTSFCAHCNEWLAKQSPTMRQAHHGGDSDSTGSIAGNLLGAMHGVDGLPARWLEQLELRDVVDRIARDLYASTVLGVELDYESYPPN